MEEYKVDSSDLNKKNESIKPEDYYLDIFSEPAIIHNKRQYEYHLKLKGKAQSQHDKCSCISFFSEEIKCPYDKCNIDRVTLPPI